MLIVFISSVVVLLHIYFTYITGVEAQTLTVWRQARRYRIPSLIYLNKLDKPGASVEKCLHSIRERLKVQPYLVTFPYGEDKQTSISGVVDVIDMNKYVWDLSKAPDGSLYTCQPITERDDGRLWESSMKERTSLIGHLSEFDEHIANEILLDTKIEDIKSDDIRRVLRKATLKRELVPVFCGSSLKNKGIQPLLDGIISYLPSPKDVSLDFVKYYGSELCAFAFKTIHDKQMKPITFFRIYSGTLKSGSSIYNINKECSEKVTNLTSISADEFQKISAATMGNIVGIKGLTKVRGLGCNNHHYIYGHYKILRLKGNITHVPH